MNVQTTMTDIAPPPGTQRLLSGSSTATRPLTLAEHRMTYPSPSSFTGDIQHEALIRTIEASGLRGRGGAAFPTGTKMRAVATGRKNSTFVVVNGTEGEPASSKDKLLMMRSPHLVLDGAIWAARAVGAREIIVCVDRSATGVVDVMRSALAERIHFGEQEKIRLETTPSRFVAGEESALVHWINGGEAKPTFTPPKPYEKGVDGKPTLVDNTETLAHVAQILRWGVDWFRARGTEAEPGTILTTVTGAVGRSGIYEVPIGVSLEALVQQADGDPSDASAVLIGGYFGTWISRAEARQVLLSNKSLGTLGSSIGCGTIVVLPKDACGLRETARVLTWMAGESTGQCGPCVNGLGAIASTTSEVYLGRADRDAIARLVRWSAQIEGRGACRFPDGAVRFLRSALRVFEADVAQHANGRACNGCSGQPALFIPPRNHSDGSLDTTLSANGVWR